MSRVVYEINCPVENCELPNSNYIGQMQNSISRRMTEHLQNGAMKDHMRNIYINILTITEIVKKCLLYK